MPTVTARIVGSDQLSRALGTLSGGPRRQAQRRGLAAGASVIETWAKFLAPVDIGTLQNSIAVDEVTEVEATIAPHTDYAEYQEFGTSQMAAQPYMRPAIDEHESDIFQAVQAEIVRFIESIRA